MNSVRATLFVVLMVCGCAVAVPTAAAPAPNAPVDLSFQSQQRASNNSTNDTNSTLGAGVNNSTLGAEISSFMQISTSQAEGSVDTGLWIARFNQTKNKSAQQALVRHHVTDMQNQLSSLQQRKQKLVSEYKHDRISRLKYQAEMSKLVGEINSLHHSIKATRPRAVTVGVRLKKLNKLDKQAKTAGGPEAREVASSMRSVHLDEEGSNNTTGGPGKGGPNGTGNLTVGGTQTVGHDGGTATTGKGISKNVTVGTGAGNGATRNTGNGKDHKSERGTGK